MVVLLHLLLLFETALVFGFTPPECHMWKKKLGLFLLFRLFLLRLTSATVVLRADFLHDASKSVQIEPNLPVSVNDRKPQSRQQPFRAQTFVCSDRMATKNGGLDGSLLAGYNPT